MALQTVTVPVRNLDAIRAGTENATAMTTMQTMASKMWKFLLVMGFMIVAISFVIGIFNGVAIADFFGESKSVREASPNFENYGTVQAIITWLAPFKLLGVGMMLAGITMTLATILGNLRVAGANVQASLGAEVKLPVPPTIAKVFPLMMMMGMMTLMAVLGIGIWLATIAGDVYGNSIADVNAAAAGSDLLADLGTVKAVKAWLTPMEFLGMAFLFTGITLGLATIVTVLQFQAQRLVQIAAEKTA